MWSYSTGVEVLIPYGLVSCGKPWVSVMVSLTTVWIWLRADSRVSRIKPTCFSSNWSWMRPIQLPSQHTSAHQLSQLQKRLGLWLGQTASWMRSSQLALWIRWSQLTSRNKTAHQLQSVCEPKRLSSPNESICEPNDVDATSEPKQLGSSIESTCQQKGSGRHLGHLRADWGRVNSVESAETYSLIETTWELEHIGSLNESSRAVTPLLLSHLYSFPHLCSVISSPMSVSSSSDWSSCGYNMLAHKIDPGMLMREAASR